MVTVQEFHAMASAFPGTSSQPHFDKTAYRTSRRIFATVSEKEGTAMLKLPEVEQSVYCSIDSQIIYPLPNQWGKHGATIFTLSKVKKSLLADALKIAHQFSS